MCCSSISQAARWRLVLLALWPGLAFGAPNQSTVPPPASIYIQSLKVDPGDPHRLYAASPGGGLFRSDNDAADWTDIRPAAAITNLNAVALDPRDSARIYTGGRGTGLWRSDDRGTHWTRTRFPGASVLDIAIDPTDSARIFVLAPTGVYRTTTGAMGEWMQVFDYPRYIDDHLPVPWPEPRYGVRLSRFQHLTIDPHHPRTLFVGVRWEGGYHRSDDGGDTWRHETLGPIFRRADQVQADPVHPGILYATTHHQGLFKSWNHGRSWVSQSHGLAPQRRTPHYGAVLLSGLTFDPADPAVLYSGSDYSNWKSTDAGTAWHELGRTLSCEFARSFVVTPAGVYAGTNVGVYRSTDEGRTWTSCNRGLPAREIIATARGAVAGEQFEFALAEGVPAVFRRSLDAGTDWVSVSWLLYTTASAIRFDAASGTLEIDTAEGVRCSRDGGLRWDVPDTVYADHPPVNPPPPAATAPAIPGHRNLAVVIRGAPKPDDALVEPMYQRPPYVYLAIVGPGYPADGSVPLWEGAWARQLSGTIAVPAAVFDRDGEKDLRIEVRDFQYGTRTGQAKLNLDGLTTVEVGL